MDAQARECKSSDLKRLSAQVEVAGLQLRAGDGIASSIFNFTGHPSLGSDARLNLLKSRGLGAKNSRVYGRAKKRFINGGADVVLSHFVSLCLSMLNRQGAHKLRLGNPPAAGGEFPAEFSAALAAACTDFLDGEDAVAESAMADSFVATLSPRAGLYDHGGAFCKAVPLEFDRVDLPTAPPTPIANVLRLCADDSEDARRMLDWIKDPPLNSDFIAKKKRVWAKPASFERIVGAGADVGLFLPVLPSEVARDSKSDLILSGAFGVDKKGGRLRLIVDLGCNGYVCAPPTGSELNLPYPSMYVQIHIGDGSEVRVNSDDDSNCFYVHRLFEEIGARSEIMRWLSMFCINKLVPLSLFAGAPGSDAHRLSHLPPDTLVYPSICCLPMGWEWSVDIVQYLQRCVARFAGLDPAREVRSDAALPDLRLGAAYAFYVDNFDEFQLYPAGSDGVQGVPSDNQVRLRKAKDELNIPINFDKASCGELRSPLLGYEFDGGGGTVGASGARRRVLFRIGMRLLCDGGTVRGPPRGHLRAFIGKNLHCMMVKRPIMSIYSDVFSVLPQWDERKRTWRPPSRRWGEESYVEILCSIGLLPLMQADLRTPFHSSLIATDASLEYGAVCQAAVDDETLLQLLRCVDYRGANVCLSRLTHHATPVVQVPNKSGKGSQLSFDPRGFDFKFSYNFKFSYPEHITLLETRVVLSFLKSFCGFRKKLFFLPDNQASGGALAKGRSASARLNGVLRRVAYFLLIKFLIAFQLWTGTSYQPADPYTRLADQASVAKLVGG